MIARLAPSSRSGGSSRPATGRERRVSLLLAIMVAATAVLFWPAAAHAAPHHLQCSSNGAIRSRSPTASSKLTRVD